MLEITSPEQLQNQVLTAEVAVLDFWAPWCAPCRAFAPTLELLAERNPNLVIAKVNVDEQKALAQAADIRSIPALVFMRKGAIVQKVVGVQSLVALQGVVDSIAQG